MTARRRMASAMALRAAGSRILWLTSHTFTITTKHRSRTEEVSTQILDLEIPGNAILARRGVGMI